MKHADIENIIKERLDKVNSAFNKARMHLHEDDIRVFRVKVKKLAASLNLFIEANDHNDHIVVPRKIEKAFQMTGALRSLKMHQNLIKKTLDGKQLAPPEKYLKQIDEKILQYKASFNDYIKDPIPFKKTEERLMKVLPENMSEKNIRRFINVQGVVLENLISQVFPPDKTLHEIRKLLKTLLYISPYTEIEFSALFPFSLLCSYDHVVVFTAILGSFHDINVAIELLHKTCEQIEIDENEKTVLRNIEALWVSEKEDVRKKIYDEIQKIIMSGRAAERPADWPVM